MLTQVLAYADVGGYDGQVHIYLCYHHSYDVTEALGLFTPFLLVDMRELCSKDLYAPADTSLEPHRLVCKAKAQSTAATQDSERDAPKSSALVGLPH